jgi:hypothetical protein
VTVDEGESQEFGLDVSHEGGNLGSIEWYVDGEYQTRSSVSASTDTDSYTHAFDESGKELVEAVVYTDDGVEGEQISWEVTIEEDGPEDPVSPKPDIETPVPPSDASPPTSQPDTAMAASSQSCQPPEMEDVQLFIGDRTIAQGDPGEISGSIATSLTNNCPVKVQLTLRVPSGVRISGSSDIESGSGGLITSTFEVDPGEVKGISANVYGETPGEKTVQSSITYFPVGHKELSREQDIAELEFTVRPSDTSTPTRMPVTTNQQDTETTPTTPGFSLQTTIMAGLVALLTFRRVCAES